MKRDEQVETGDEKWKQLHAVGKCGKKRWAVEIACQQGATTMAHGNAGV